MKINNEFLLSEKYIDFMKHNVSVELLEGTTFAGKTTVGAVKFLLKVAKSEKKLHILSGLDKGTIEKNIIIPDYGVLDVFGIYEDGGILEYNPNGKVAHAMAHLILHTKKDTKIIYVLGYDDKTRWKKALGGQYGCLYIDEINIADMDYVREATMRYDYLLATLNPDDPSLPIYEEYINHSRPIEKYKNEAPRSIQRDMNLSKPVGDWTHWFFTFKDNISATEEKIKQIKASVPKGTKIYKNKILGERGRAQGLVFPNFNEVRNVISESILKEKMRENNLRFVKFTMGVDTAYSTQSEDTIAFIFQGITNNSKDEALTIADDC